MNPADRKFQKLQDHWYEKLRASGFEDVESKKTGIYSGNAPLSQPFKACIPFTRLQLQSRKSYYDWAHHVLEIYSFRNNTQRKIWEAHTEGLSIRAIAQKVARYQKSWVHVIIQRMKVILRLRNPITDDPFILASWAENGWYGRKDREMTRKKEWIADKRASIQNSLELGHTFVACLKDDPNHIIGFQVNRDHQVEFRYIKKDYRNAGVEDLFKKIMKEPENEK
jgi:hypothetical protein